MNTKLALAGLLATLAVGLTLGFSLLVDEPGPRSVQAPPPSALTRLAYAPRVAVASPTNGDPGVGRKAPAPQQAVCAAAPSELELLLADGTPDALYEAVTRVDALAPAVVDRAQLESLLEACFRVHDDWELLGAAFRLERRFDPAGHRAHVLAVSAEPASDVGLLVGALDSLTEVDADTQGAFLVAMARAQSAALVAGPAELEAIQRQELAEGAMAELLRRYSPHERVVWLLEAEASERTLLAAQFDEQHLLVGQAGLSTFDARRLVGAIVLDAAQVEDLAGWGPELRILQRLPAEALDVPALRATLERALRSSNEQVRWLASDLLAHEQG